MANTIQLKRSSTASDTPTASDLAVGELAVNTADAKLFTKHTDNSIVEISSGSGGGSSLSNIADATGGVSVTGDLTTDEVFLANSTDHKIGKVNHTYGDGIGLTTDNATVTIGAGNSSYIHYFSSGGQQHWFNTDVNTNGNFYVYSDAGSLTWINNRGTTHEVTLTTTTPSAARTIALPDATGTVALNESGILNLTNSGSQSELRMYCEDGNAHYAALKAPAHADLQSSGAVTLTLPNNTGTLINSVGNTSIQFLGASNSHKIQFWNASTQYSMGMASGYSYGSIGGASTEYAIVTTMNDSDARGFLWRDAGHTGAQGAMSLTTTGKMTVADSIRVGYGESDTVVSGTTHDLEVNGSISAAGLAYPSTDGSNGQVLTTNGSGTLSFQTVSGGGGSSGNGFFVIEAERSGSASLNQNFAFGNGASTIQGVRVPIATTLKYLTITCDAGSQTLTVTLIVNNSATTQTISLLDGQSATTSELNYSINANDHIAFRVTSGSASATTTVAAWFAAGITNTNADTVDSKHISVVTSLPASPDSNTIYFVTS